MATRSSTILAVAIVIGLVVGVGAGYVAWGAQVSSLQSQLTQSKDSASMAQAELQNYTVPIALSPQGGQMVESAWLFIAPTGMGDYSVVISASGLDNSSSNAFIVEAVSKTGSMSTAPITGNDTTSEFEANPSGNGLFAATLMSDPRTTFETIEVFLLPGMSMTSSVLIASANLT